MAALLTSSGSSGIPLNALIGGSIGAFFFLLIVGIGGFFAVRSLRIQASHRAFLLAFRTAEAGKKADASYLPLKLRKFYAAEEVLGKGAFGCVLRVRSLKTEQLLAVKLIVPEKGTFDERELRQLTRESTVLQLFTGSKCEHAVHLAGIETVNVQADLAW